MMRWRLFYLWVAVTFVLIAISFSDFFFGRGNAKRLGLRVLLSFVWPLAALSSAGREILFRAGRKL